jgi:hypothetical protein
MWRVRFGRGFGPVVRQTANDDDDDDDDDDIFLLQIVPFMRWCGKILWSLAGRR